MTDQPFKDRAQELVGRVPVKLEVLIVNTPFYRPDLTVAEARLINPDNVHIVTVDGFVEPKDLPNVEGGVVMCIDNAEATLIKYAAIRQRPHTYMLTVPKAEFNLPIWSKPRRVPLPKMTRDQRRGKR